MRKNSFPLRTFLFLLCAEIFLASCEKASALPKKRLSIHAAGGTVELVAEIASTDAQKSRGYMEREHIPDGTGMLFVYERDEVMRFWMKNTPHPLSIAFILSDGTILDIFDMKPFSLAETASSASCRYALEVPQGWFSRAGVRAGDRLDISALRD